ncbi:MAG: hypothetical protein WCT18_02535 [Patescibacteria group bacterium]
MNNKNLFQKIARLLCFCFVIISLTGCGQKPIQSYDPAQINPRPLIYRNDNFHFTLNLPKSWAEANIHGEQKIVDTEKIETIVFDLQKQKELLVIYVFPKKEWQKQTAKENSPFVFIKELPKIVFAYKKNAQNKILTDEEKLIPQILRSFEIK